MVKSYLRAAWRSLRRNRTHAVINIAGLTIGMSVALLIGLWIWDEISFDKYHSNYDRIAQVMQRQTFHGTIHTGGAIPLPLDQEMHKSYGRDFKHIVMASWTDPHILTSGDRNISSRGSFMSAEGPEMLTLRMASGTINALKSPSSLLLSQSTATALFGNTDPVGQPVQLDNKASFLVKGVYKDLPLNSTFRDLSFIAPWDVYASQPAWLGRSATDWSDNSLLMYVQLTDQADLEEVSKKIKNCKLINAGPGEARFHPEIFLHPMSKWHLYEEFKDGVNTGGAIRYVWLFGIIGIFVLLLACINFMNLSTARSEKRAREVGVRKVMGSLRTQLISQFFCESFLTVLLSFILCLLLSWQVLPFFNQLAGKQMAIPFNNPLLWAFSLTFILFTGLISGSYPAFYLSSFRPVKVLKGTFKAGPRAALPRKALVVFQFTVSVILIIGTLIVFKQIQFAKDRPVGYNRQGLISIETATPDLHSHFAALRTDLLQSGTVTAMAESTSPTTGINNNRSDLSWKGKDPSMTAEFGNILVTSDYSNAVGWQFVAGRDFSPTLSTDSSAVILNEAAIKYTGLNQPVGEIIRIGKKDFTIIGVIKDMVMGSPYEPVKPTLFRIGGQGFDYINVRVSPTANIHQALSLIESTCKAYAPAVPFSFKFADDEYARKFHNEERIGKLAAFFTSLAIFISCLGLFGMASFMAEQRTREIAVRKVLGASIFSLWKLMNKEFVSLVVLSLLIATPLAYYLMASWLRNFHYRTPLHTWIFAVAALSALLITLLTVSWQIIRTALNNPVESLRAE